MAQQTISKMETTQITMAQKDKQKQLLTEVMNEDAKDGLYDVPFTSPYLGKPFHIAFLREITDQYDCGEISYGKMVEMLNEIAIKWHEKLSKYNPMTDGTPYPFASGPIDNGYKLHINPIQTAVEWLKERYNQGSDYEKHLTEDEFKQAKEMEKQQIMDAATWGYLADTGEQYYKEKYNK